MNFKEGQNQPWYWIETSSNYFDFGDIKEHCPELINGYFVAINSFDSGTITWALEELAKGFSYVNETPITNAITDLNDIPTAGYDEWFMFSTKKEFDLKDAYINYTGFSLHADDSNMEQAFWDQLNRVQPDKFMAQNGHFIFVTLNRNDIEKIKALLVNLE